MEFLLNQNPILLLMHFSARPHTVA